MEVYVPILAILHSASSTQELMAIVNHDTSMEEVECSRFLSNKENTNDNNPLMPRLQVRPWRWWSVKEAQCCCLPS